MRFFSGHLINGDVILVFTLVDVLKYNTVKPRLFEVPGTAGILSNNR